MDNLYNNRAMAVRLLRPGARPVTLINFHGHPDDAYSAGRAATALVMAAAELGDAWILLGDHNLLAQQWPYSALSSSGRAASWDEFFIDATHCGTRRRSDGSYTGRTIDFAFAHTELVARL